MILFVVSTSDRFYTRRRLLQSGAAAGVLGVVGAGAAAAQSSHLSSSGAAEAPPPVEPPPPEHGPAFQHGVASGDPVPESVILWTRLTPSVGALPGSGVGAPTTVAWEVARDVGFSDVVTRGETMTDAANDHTVHVDPWGLAPSTVYYFRFRVVDGEFAGAVSPTGRTQTAPALDSEPGELNFAVASCANWESGFFAAYSDMASRGWAGELDLCVFLGDYIYEYGQGEYTAPAGAVRLHHPAHETITLADYRVRYGRYRTDPDLQAAHGALPWAVTWDDHETANNSWRDGAENHSADEGSWYARRDAAMQAYFEWLPVRTTAPSREGHLYRSLQFGNLVELTMMDLRTYRNEDVYSFRAFNDPDRTMMGSEQFSWLKTQVETSTAQWNVLGNSVMMAPMALGNLEGSAATVRDLLGKGYNGIPLNPDQWDGYQADRARLLRVLSQQDAGTLFLTGDIHTEWANSVIYNGSEIGVELVCASVSAPNVDEQLGLPPENHVSHLAEDTLRVSNPHVHHVDLDSHGYSIARIFPDRVQMRWLRVDDITVQGSPVRMSLGFTWRRGRGFTA